MSADGMPGPSPRLNVLRQTLRFTAKQDGCLPDWLGSAWRGAFGRQLKSLVCITGLPGCEPCGLYRQCAYPRIFETPPDPTRGKMRKYTDVPRPYVLLPFGGGEVRAGESLPLEIRLFGREIQRRELVVEALRRAAEHGLGRTLLPLQLEAMDPPLRQTLGLESAGLHDNSTELELEFIRPLRLRVQGRSVGPEDLNFGDFFSALLRRISMICTFHEEPFEVDFRSLVGVARALEWSRRELTWAPLKRYSQRQQRGIDLSGLLGKVALPADTVRPLLKYLEIGQHTLVGRGAVMGLGEYRIVPPI